MTTLSEVSAQYKRRRGDSPDGGDGERVGCGGTRCLLLVVVVSAFPVYWTFTIASQTNEAVGQTPPPLLPGGNFFANARRVFDTDEFGKAMWNSVIVATSITASTLLFCSWPGSPSPSCASGAATCCC